MKKYLLIFLILLTSAANAQTVGTDQRPRLGQMIMRGKTRQVISAQWQISGVAAVNKPNFLIEPYGTTSSSWNTSGTGLGINAPSGFTGAILDAQTNGTTRLVVLGAGNVGISNSAPNTLLNVAGGTPTTAASGLQFGTDAAANLYRLTTGSIRTDASTFWVNTQGNITNNSVNFPTSGGTITSAGTTAMSGFQSGTAGTITSVSNGGSNSTWTSGEGYLFAPGSAFTATSGNGIFDTIASRETINQTSTATGVTRGFYTQPTLTSTSDYRGLEVGGYTNNLLGNPVVATQRGAYVVAPTYTATTAAQTITNASSLEISGLPVASTNITITNGWALRVAAGISALPGYASTGTKFTTSGCSISATSGGATAGTFTLGANTCTAVITMNGATGMTAPTGWSCQAHDKTAPTILIGGESSSNTTTASITIPAGAGATDVISFSCVGY